MVRFVIVSVLVIAGAGCGQREHSVVTPTAGPGVRVIKRDGGWQLERNGEPYFIRGVGGWRNPELLAQLGGNSMRTWGVQDVSPRSQPNGQQKGLLDLAHELGLTVCVGIWVQHPRHGFDYSDKQTVQQQIDAIRTFVREYKDHPAVLMWGIGNEVETDADREVVFRAIEDIAKAVKEEDPNHPTMVALAGVWDGKVKDFKRLCPTVDILGINVYGGLPVVPDELRKQGYDKPFIITEFGPIGHWETEQTSWDAPVEPSSTDKLRILRRGYEAAIRSQSDRCFGSYVFYWGQKQERTESWYGMFLKTGEKTPAVDAIVYEWTGAWPDNRAPGIDAIESTAHSAVIQGGSRVAANVHAWDHEDDPLEYRWLVKKESTDHGVGGEAEREPPVVDVSFERADTNDVTFVAPGESGAYRLFVFVYDGQGGGATSNAPFFVE